MQTILFFDIDSTLVENHFSRKALGELLGQIATVANKPIEALGRELWMENNRRQQDDPDNVLTMDWDDMIETLAHRYGVTLQGRAIDLWRKYASATDVEVLDTAHEVLQTLKDAGYTLVIATKGLKKYQDPVLSVVGLDTYFDDMLTPDITGFLKTSPSYFNKYVLNREGKRFIHIGDHYVDDVISARRNGFYSILRTNIADLAAYDAFTRPHYISRYAHQISTYPKTGTEVVPNAVVLSLTEVPTVVQRLIANED